MNWAKLALLLLQIARMILENRNNGALINAGKAEAENEQIKTEMARINEALKAGAGIKPVSDRGSLSDDPYNRG